MSKDDTKWIEVQKKTFTRWANTFLVERNMPIQDLQHDLKDGIALINLLELISTHKFQRWNKNPKILNQKLENLGYCLNFLKAEGLKLVGIGPEDVNQGNLKLILGLIWTIILRYHIEKGRKESAKAALLEWVRSKIPEYDVKNFTTSWADGMAICALVNALLPESIDMSQRDKSKPMENAEVGTNTAEEKMKIPKVFQPEDMVNSADELSCMTYISYFRDYDENAKKRAAEDEARRLAAEAERTPDPSKCTASGLGLQTGEVNIPSDFIVTARNALGKQIPCGGATVAADITAPDGSKVSEITVVDNNNGTYGVTYIPRVDGKHLVTVNINNAPITKDVPVNVLPPQPDPSKCTATGPGVEGAMAGNPVQFVVQARNKIDDPIKIGGHPFKADVKGPFGEEIPCELKDNQDGTYTGEYEPIPGLQTVAITCAGRPISGSPYSAQMTADPNKAFAGKSYADGTGVEGPCNTFDPCPFTIHAISPSGEPLNHGGDVFTATVEGPDGSELPAPEIKDNGDGTYTGEYKAKSPGPHAVHINLHHPTSPLFIEPIKNSPYNIQVGAGLDPSKCEVFGPGVEKDGVTDTMPTKFTVKTRDCDGKDIPQGGLPIDVKVTDPNGKDIPTNVVDNGDGTYCCDYAPDDVGDHKVEVTCKGAPIGKSPYTVSVEEGADCEHTGVGTFTFTVQARSRKGEPLTRGGDKMTADVECKNPPCKTEAECIDLNDGTYMAKYTCPGAGHYRINVQLNGRKIKGSPFKQTLP